MADKWYSPSATISNFFMRFSCKNFTSDGSRVPKSRCCSLKISFLPQFFKNSAFSLWMAWASALSSIIESAPKFKLSSPDCFGCMLSDDCVIFVCCVNANRLFFDVDGIFTWERTIEILLSKSHEKWIEFYCIFVDSRWFRKTVELAVIITHRLNRIVSNCIRFSFDNISKYEFNWWRYFCFLCVSGCCWRRLWMDFLVIFGSSLGELR